MGFSKAPSVQSPAAWALNNVTSTYLRATLADSGYLFRITAAETAAGMVLADLTLGFPPGDFRRYGGVGNGVTDDTTAIQRAHNQGAQNSTTAARPYCPPGAWLHTTTITPCVLGQKGAGSKRSRMVSNGVHTFTVASDAGWDRPAVVFEKFGIDSNNGTSCDAKFAFYFGGVASGAAAVYNSGFTARDIEIGRVNRMGGGFYLKDVFRANIENIGMTDVSRMIQVVGSVVQCKFRNVTSNNDSAGSGLSKYGISTEAATYSGASTLTPENLRFIDCAYIRGNRGISHTAGLDVEFVNFDTEADAYGMLLNAACNVRGGIVVPGSGATDWVGVSRGVSISDPDDFTFVDGLDINCLRQPGTPASSYGFDIGDGVSPVYGMVIKNCRIRGITDSLTDGIRTRDCRDLTLEDNFIREATVTNSHLNISGRRLFIERNRIPSGVMVISDGSDSSAYGIIRHNQAGTLTFTPTTSDNWTLVNPDISGSATRMVPELKGTFTFTLTGCTTSPTGTGRYVVHGRVVTIFIPAISGTSNATTATLTGLPNALYPNRQQDQWGSLTNAGTSGFGSYRVKTDGVIELYVGTNYAAFTNSGTKAVNACALTYSLD